jgi:hypothetical protein
MTKNEYSAAKKGIWKDGSGLSNTPSEYGRKWVWSTREAAKNWLKYLKSYGEEGGIIVKVKVKKPLKNYEHYDHWPQGTAIQIPLEHLGKAKNIGTR